MENVPHLMCNRLGIIRRYKEKDMKKLFGCILVVCLLATTACQKEPVVAVPDQELDGNHTEVREVVVQFLDAFLAADFETASSLTKIENGTGGQEIPAELHEFMRTLSAHVDYEIVYSTVTGDAATVTVKIYMVDMGKFLSGYLRKIATQAAISGDVSMDKMLEGLETALAEADDERKDFDCPFLLEKTDGEWLITDGEGFEDALLGGIKDSKLMDLIGMFK